MLLYIARNQPLPGFIIAESDTGFPCDLKMSFKTEIFFVVFCFLSAPA